MGLKKSVWFADHTIEVCKAITQNASAINFSGSLNAMAEQYSILIEECRPAMTDNQALAIACCYNGYMPSDSLQQELRLLPWHISEGYQYDEQVRDLIGTEEDAQSFIEQAKNWTDAQRLSVIFQAKSYWSKNKPTPDEE